MQEDAARTGDEVRAETTGVGVDERHPHAVAVDHAQIRRVAVEAGGGDLAGPSEIDRGPSIRNAFGIEEPNRVGSVEEFGRPVVPGLDRCLDEDVRAQTVVVELDPVRDRCRQQGEVPLACRWHRPDLMAEGVDLDRLDPARLHGGEVGGRELVGAGCQQALTELALEEAGAAVTSDRPRARAEPGQ